LYPEDGETDGARAIDNAEFFLRLGQKICAVTLATPTVEGFVYRVDLRLAPVRRQRPRGAQLPAFEHYLQEHGRDWERYAYVSAALTAIEHYAELYDQVLRPRLSTLIRLQRVCALREMKGDDLARSGTARAAGQT
jgi:glutamate-ammonia-ligase adenylyltransferase